MTKPGDARAALDEIERRTRQAIDGALVPGWYWWAVAIPMIGLGAIVDGHDAVAIAAAAVVFALGVAILTGWVIFGGLGVKVAEGLLGPTGAGLIVGFVGLLVAGSLALAFVLQGAGFGYPATVATLCCAVALVLGGPALMGRLRGSMQGRGDVSER